MSNHTRSLKAVLAIATAAVMAVAATVLPSSVKAAGVSVSVTPNEITANTATDVTVTFTPSGEYESGDTVTLTWDSSVTVADAASSTTDADGDTTADGAASVSSPTYTYTFSASTTQASTNGVSFSMNVTADTGIYSVSMTDSNGNYGAALIYVGDDNDVTVTAIVQPTLSFAIRTSNDSADTNSCDLGVLTTTAVAECSYRLKVATNANNGFTVSITTDGDLRRAGTGDVADADDIDLIAEDSTVTAGTEGYGIAFDGGSITGGTVTESGDFNDDDTPLPMSATTLMTTDGNNNPGNPDTTNTALVTHRAAIDADTNTGNYSQTVTYYVTASF